ncbi:hypothetical protein IWW36_001546 [Coemansia brasiliensis]|uniref:G-protein coupled receptors family 3 profile domain-containing protein n=1 Tax=Coemansia brasiliensis TaxID=2650707 RepID=A0A9W8M0S0_9FUNG|nr:hypothetical protein IWW36_001546 [Coemansia brasiliensis]
MPDIDQFDGLPPLQGEERVQFLQKLTGLDIQLVDGSDLAVIIISFVFCLLTLLFLAYVWLNHNYRPIRAKTVKLCTLMYMVAITWLLGDLQMNNMVNLTGGWKHCRTWVVWVRILSSYAYSGMLMIRFYALDRIFNQSKPYKGRAMYAPAVGLTVVLLAYCLTCQFVDAKYISKYFDYVQICVVDSRFRYVSIGLMWVPWTVVLVLAFRLRNIQSSFNERYESLVICLLAYTILIKTTVIHATHPFYIFEKSYRQSETLIDAICSNAIIWLMLGYPAYQCMFNREKYETEWMQKLRQDGRIKRYSVKMQPVSHSTTGYSQIGGSTFQNPLRIEGSQCIDSDPLDSFRLLSQNNQTLTMDLIAQPSIMQRRPVVDFSTLQIEPNMLSANNDTSKITTSDMPKSY